MSPTTVVLVMRASCPGSACTYPDETTGGPSSVRRASAPTRGGRHRRRRGTRRAPRSRSPRPAQAERTAVELGVQALEAEVPAGAGAGRVATLRQGVEEDEARAVAIGLELDPQRSSPHWSSSRRGGSTARHGRRGPPPGCSGRRRSEAWRRLEVADDALREPRVAVLGLDDGAPHLVDRVVEPPLEAEGPRRRRRSAWRAISSGRLAHDVGVPRLEDLDDVVVDARRCPRVDEVREAVEATW